MMVPDAAQRESEMDFELAGSKSEDAPRDLASGGLGRAVGLKLEASRLQDRREDLAAFREDRLRFLDVRRSLNESSSHDGSPSRTRGLSRSAWRRRRRSPRR